MEKIKSFAKKHPVWTGVIGIFILFILIGIFSGGDNSSSEEKVISYETLEKDTTYPTVENFYILISSIDISEENINQLVNFIDENRCKKKCNIYIYDDKQAYILDKEFEEIISLSEKTVWENKNYIFVAEHLVASKSFDTSTPWMYPFKDWKYDELKEKLS